MEDASAYLAMKDETLLDNLSELWSFQLLSLNTCKSPTWRVVVFSGRYQPHLVWTYARLCGSTQRPHLSTAWIRLVLYLLLIPDRNELNPLNLSILLSGGKENNCDNLSSGERKGLSTAGNSFGNLSCVNLDSLCRCSVSGMGYV